MRSFRSKEMPYPSPSNKQAAKIMPSIPEPSNEGFAKATELKEKTVNLEGKRVKTKGTGAATKGLDFTSYIN
tara:strand:- start:1087 stop:1302 length:216 start_codon:yes stop_codon:yes gene_type:complete